MGFLAWLQAFEGRAREAGIEVDRLTWDETHRYLKEEEIKQYEAMGTKSTDTRTKDHRESRNQ